MIRVFQKVAHVIQMMCSTTYNHLIWFIRDIRYGMICRNRDDLENRLLVGGHIIEKGITMPNRRYGFGIGVVRLIQSMCDKYMARYGSDNEQLQFAIDDLREYLQIHQDNGYELPADMVAKIERTIDMGGQNSLGEVDCLELNKEELFKQTSDFKEFAHSRHTCRWYSGEPVDKELISKAIDLARTSPSACNRQSIKVYAVSGEKKDEVIELQNGNRGFGEDIGQMLVVTSNQIDWDADFRTSAYLDGGIFTMNLLYALHYYHICACTLNAHLSIKKQKKLREITGMKASEIPVCFIGIGMPSEKMRIAKSRRLSVEQVLNFVD